MVTTAVTVRSTSRAFPVLPAAVVGASIAVWLFYGQMLGWTTGAFVVVVTVVCLLRSASYARDRIARTALTFVTLTLAGTLVEQPTLLSLLCTIAAFVLLAMTCRAGWTSQLRLWLRRAVSAVLGMVARPLQDFVLSARWARRHPRLARGTLRRAALWVIPVLLGGVFVALFAVANPIVEQWLNNLITQVQQFFDSIDLWLEPGCVVFWCCFAGAIYTLLRFRRQRSGQPARPAPTEGWTISLLDTAMAGAVVVRCLIVFNAIFAVQSALDGVYLIGKRALPARMTYVQYAHRGAYPLIATALLAGIFVLITFRDTAHAATRRDARWLVYLWIAQNVGLTASAAWRLKLLIEHSDLTRLRLATTIWLLLVSLGLCILIWRIARQRSSEWLVRVNLSMALLTLYSCCFLNLDGFIAHYNAGREEQDGPDGRGISLEYLQHLGPIALPAVRALEQELPTLQRRNAACAVEMVLREELRVQLADWRGWTWRRGRLQRWCEEHPERRVLPLAAAQQIASEAFALERTADRSESDDSTIERDWSSTPPVEIWCRILRRRRKTWR